MSEIRDIMVRDVVTIPDYKTALDVSVLLRDRDISFVVVMSDEKPIGVITERDIVRRVAAEDVLASAVPISDIISKNFFSVEPTTSIEVAVQKMFNSNVRRLVVLEDDALVGVVTQTDLASFLRSRLLIKGIVKKT